MGLWCWIFYIVAGIGAYFILNLIDSRYTLNKVQKIIFSIIFMMIVSGICFEMALNVTDNIFLMFVFMMITDIFYNSYVVERDFFNKDEKNIYYYILLTLIGFFINQDFINKVTKVFLTGEDLRLILWSLTMLFIYNFCREKNILTSVSKNTDKYMSVDSCLVSYAKLKHKFYDDCDFSNREISNMIYAIMIYENSKRSKLYRKYDYFMFRLNGEKRKLGIMQVESNKFITDSESINIVYKKISKLYDKEKSKKSGDICDIVFDKYLGEESKKVKYIFNIIKKF